MFKLKTWQGYTMCTPRDDFTSTSAYCGIPWFTQLLVPLNFGASAIFESSLWIVCNKICIFPETQSILTEYNKWKVILQEMKI
jgi:hypothetical protein